MELKPDETMLIGQWIDSNGKTLADYTCYRIESLIKRNLKKIAHNESENEMLYQDTNDGRYWELSYPQRTAHSQGPPMLQCLTADKANYKYHVNLKT